MLKRVLKQIGNVVSKANSFQVVKEVAPNQIGVYIMSLKGKVMYVGRAIEDRPGQIQKAYEKDC